MGRRRRLGPVTKMSVDTSEGTWMNVDVSPDGKRIVFDLLGDIYTISIDGSAASAATRLTSGPAFDMQPRFSPDGKRIAILERPRRPVEHLDDRRGRQGCETGLARAPVVREQPDLVARRRIRLCATAFRQGALARRRRNLDVSRGGAVERPAGDRAHGLAEGQRRARRLARWPLPLLQQGRHTRSDLRIQQGPERDDLRDHAPRSDDRPRAPRGQRAGWIGRAAGVARRQDARLRPAREAEIGPVSPRPRERTGSRSLREGRQGSAGSLGHPRLVPAVRVDARRPIDRDLGRGKDLESRRDVRQGRRGAVHRARRADDQRGGPLSSRRRTRTNSRCACFATCASRRTARPWSTARWASCMSNSCPMGSRAGSPRTIGSSSFRLSRATGSGLSTRRGRMRKWAGSESSVRMARPAAMSWPGPDTTSSRRSRQTVRRSCSVRSAATRRGARTLPTIRACTSSALPAANRCWCATLERIRSSITRAPASTCGKCATRSRRS